MDSSRRVRSEDLALQLRGLAMERRAALLLKLEARAQIFRFPLQHERGALPFFRCVLEPLKPLAHRRGGLHLRSSTSRLVLALPLLAQASYCLTLLRFDDRARNAEDRPDDRAEQS
jgi:hypothetical protein